LERDVLRRGLPDRVMMALMDAVFGYKVRNATYRPMAEISDNMASRDLKALVDAGLLIPHGEKRQRYYLGSDTVKAIRGKTRETGPIEDPFAPAA
jgi:hypothetical protein